MPERSFPLPSQIEAVAGAEGWEAMYPYFSRFQPEDDQRFWFYNSMHFPEVVPAFDGITSEIEMIPIQKIEEAYERMLRSDVKYRFVIDMATLDTSA